MAIEMGLVNCPPFSGAVCSNKTALTLAERNNISATPLYARFGSIARQTVAPWTLLMVRSKIEDRHDATKGSLIARTRERRFQQEDYRMIERNEKPSSQDVSSYELLSTSPSEEGNAAVLDESRNLGKSSVLPSKNSTCCRGLPKEEIAHINGKNSMGVTSGLEPNFESLQVAVDVDEVLGSFLSTLNVFIAERYFQDYNLSEYYVYDFMKIWDCSQAEANDRVHAFFDSEHFNDGICPIPGAYQSLCHLAEFCDLVVVTSRQHVIKKPTLEWIEKHYSGLFKEVHFGNHFALEGKPRPKSEICRSIGAQILIDDNPRYAVECAKHGIEVLLFDFNNNYPWSKTADGPVHPLITRVQNWIEVEHALFTRFCL